MVMMLYRLLDLSIYLSIYVSNYLSNYLSIYLEYGADPLKVTKYGDDALQNARPIYLSIYLAI